MLGVADLGAQVFALSRLPRTLAVLLTGAALAIAGVVMQQLVRNRFVEPGTTGTAEGAALGLLAITLWAPGAALWLKMAVASLSAMAACVTPFSLRKAFSIIVSWSSVLMG